MRRKILIAVGVLAGVLILTTIGLLLYVEFGDLTRHGGMVGRIVTDAIGREFRFDGKIELAIGVTSRVVAEDVTLANPDWSADPAMVHADRIEATVDLFSLFGDTIRIHDVKATGASVALEVDARGRASWDFPSDGSGDGEIVGLQIAHADIAGFRFSYRDEDLGAPIEVALDRAVIRADETWMLDVDLNGRFRGAPLSVRGKVSSLDDWIAADAVEHDLRGSLDGAAFATQGTIEQLAKLGGVDLTVDASGPSLAAVGPVAGVDGLPEDPFKVSGRVLCSGYPCTFENFVVRLGDDTLSLEGTLGAPPELLGTEFTFDASGPNLGKRGALAGIDLPPESFSVAGRIVRREKGIGIENVEARVGRTELRAHGVVGDPPEYDDSDLQVRVFGPDLAVFRDLAGIDLPRESFEVEGRVGDAGTSVALDGVRARLGENRVSVDGTVDPEKGFIDTDLRVSASGPDLAAVAAIAGVEGMPREPFRVEGAVRVLESGYELRRVEARVGDVAVRAHGRVGPLPEIAGTDLDFHVDGPDLSRVGAFAGVDDLPAEPFRVDGGAAVLRSGYRLREVEARIGDVTVRAHGRVGPLPEIAGTDLDIHVDGPDLSWMGALAGRDDLPVEPFRLDGEVAALETGYELRGIDARVGGLTVQTEGRLGLVPDLDGTSLRLEARLATLSAVGPYVDRTLPEEPVAVTGTVFVEEETFHLDDLEVVLGQHRLNAEGSLVPTGDFIGTDLAIEIAVADISEIGRFVEAAGIDVPIDLPPEVVSISGRLSVRDEGFRLHGVDVGVRRGNLHVDGLVGHPPDFVGSDLTFEGEGPEGVLVRALTDYDVPAMPLRIAGRVEKIGDGVRFHRASVQWGDYLVEANGTLGKFPKFIGTDFEIHAEGPNLELVGNILGKPDLPDDPFDASGRFEGSPTQFSMPRLEVQLGPSDLSGSFTVDLRDKPDLQGRFVSKRVDLSRKMDLLRQEAVAMAETEETETQAVTATEDEEVDGVEYDFDEDAFDEDDDDEAVDGVLSDEPFNLDALHKANIDLRWTIDDLALPATRLTDFDLGINLQDGRVVFDPVSGSVESGGDVEGRFALEPSEEGYRMRAELTVDELRINLTTQEKSDPSTWTPFDIDLAVEATGRSPHGLASTLSGDLLVNMGEGRMDNTLVSLVVADILVTMLDALNPFRKDEPFTRIECGVFNVDFTDGVADLKPLVLRTDKMTMTGNGRIRFLSERIRLDWVTKPRRGIGLSASTLTNPYIRLGGTLSKPAIEMKPLEAITSTGVAWATVGLSVVGRGLWDRITAETNVCAKAVKKMEKQERKEQKKAEGN